MVDYSGKVVGFSDKVGVVSNKLSGFITGWVTIRNIFFVLILIAVCVICFKLWQKELLRKKYYGRKYREI